MSHTEELIIKSQAGDSLATEMLVNENAGLIWSVAKRFLGRGVEADDLYQLGCLGFLKAVDGFDTAYGTQFSTYAVPKIAGEIRRFLRDDGTIKVSRSVKERAQIIRTVRNQLMLQLDRDPSIQELADATGLTMEEIAIAEAATASTRSIQQESGEEGFSLEDILSTTDTEEALVETIALRQAVDRLPERESVVIRLRYYHGLTQERVSRVLLVSQVQVSRIEKKALVHLKEILT
jgi:RNA polymerase sporulation-specific sigma factor